MQAAEELFTSRRFHEITMDDIADAAGVAKGTLYGYFRDKEDLFSQTTTSGLEELCELIEQNVLGEAPFAQQLLDVCRQVTGFFESRHQLFRLMQAEEGRMFYCKGGLHDRWMEKRRKLVSAVAGILARGVRAGLLRRDVPADALANILLGMLRTRVRDLAESSPRVRRHEVILDLFCRGAALGSGPARKTPRRARQGIHRHHGQLTRSFP